MLVNKNKAVHCLFMLVHSELTNVTRILMIILISTEISKCHISAVHLLTNVNYEPYCEVLPNCLKMCFHLKNKIKTHIGYLN